MNLMKGKKGLIMGVANERSIAWGISQKLAEFRPTNLARAGRIPGVTPAAMSLLLVYLKKRAMSESLRATANG